MLKLAAIATLGLAVGLAAGAVLTPGSDTPPVVTRAAATPSPAPAPSAGPITAVWANDGGDKVAREELRSATGVRPTSNRVWDGHAVSLFAARNEIVSFNLILEAADRRAEDVTVALSALVGPGGRRIAADQATSRDGVFDWTRRPIELFRVGYLPIRGLSALSYETYDERHVPARFQRPMDADGVATGGWADRPDHDAHYPDIAVPLELEHGFAIEAPGNQSVWIDVAVPRDTPAGRYAGTVSVEAAGAQRIRIPVVLDVADFALPEEPAVATMVATSYREIAARYTGEADPKPNSPEDRLARLILKRQHLLAHRHRISLVDDNGGAAPWPHDRPRPDWEDVLSGALFTPANGYAGPGESLGSGVFAIGLYGGWRDLWKSPDQTGLLRHLDGWETWFRANAPGAKRFLYVADEAQDLSEIERIAGWMKAAPGPARSVASFATADLLKARTDAPSLAIVASWIAVADTARWTAALDALRQAGGELWLYNGRRPASGSFAIEDDGVALRELAWGQAKLGVDRWFFWEATYYDDFQGGRGPTDLFATAQTFGGQTAADPILGAAGWNASNGDGVLFYPGTDAVFPNRSFDLAGPIASLRLKHWRRGIQDVAYIRLAEKVDPDATRAIVQRMVPKVLWEVGVDDPADPTYVRGPISWSVDPDDWETARAELAAVITRRP